MKSWLRNLFKVKLKLVRDQDTNLLENVYQFSYQTLERATNNFSNMISMNGHSSSYKGTLADGSVIVVKELTNPSIDFMSMITTMSGIKHRNVVELLGCCVEDGLRILVHEFTGDFSLERLLFPDSEMGIPRLDWTMRASICHGIAHCLEYLVVGISPSVIHLDVKPSNILLDSSFNPKIIDFEFAALLGDDESHHSGNVRGTLGYIDPEFAMTGRYSDKTDVFSFGVVLLEMISGRKCSSFFQSEGMTMVDFVWELRESNRILEFVDPTLYEFSEDEVMRFVDVALFCCQYSANLRPSMSEVRLMLIDGYNFSHMVLTKPEYIPSWTTNADLEAFSDHEVDSEYASDTELPR